ncbi:MAG: DUF6797 domain-containing protein [Planctomycetota bacterium]
MLAQELKSSATHWELFTMPESGHFTVYLPGHRPDHVRSTVDIADDRWHHVAMVYEANRIRLYVDGKMAADQPIEFLKGQTVAGGVGIGQVVGKEIGCHGLIDGVRISRGVRTFETRPTEAPVVDDNTIGLWHCDRVPDTQLPTEPNKEPKVERLIDESKQQNHGQLGAADPGVNKGNGKGAVARREDHWGMEAVGFNWTEQDSVDNRWNQTDVGSFLASTVPLAGLSPVRKGLSIRVGEGEQGTMCYDTARMQLRAAWQNGFLQFHPARFGLINSPAPKGEMQWMVPEGPGWMGGTVRYRGLQPQGQRVLLQYEVGTTAVSELPGLRKVAAGSVFLRTLALGAAKEELRLRLGRVQGGKDSRQLAADVVLVERADKTLITCVVGNDLPRWDTAADGRLDLVFAPQGTSRTCLVQQIVIPTPPDDAARKSLDAIVQELRRGKPESIEAFARPGAARWTAEITTQGRRGKDTDAPYVIDTITLPYENPYRALFFVGGHDFYSNGDIALCTVHGDVWRVSGVQEKLERLVWKRVATGMFQPLGLKIAAVKRSDGSQEKDIVYVLGRDQITRLYDRNADGEADYYECFSNDYETSPGGHDYVTCLETDSRGNFYFTHALHGIVRLDAEGKSLGSWATGLRNPNGMGMGPGDVVTAAPQEGEWTPGSAIFQARQGNHFGYQGPRVTADRPLGYDPPICWIPRLHDNSSGGQVWVTSDRWGPLTGQMLHLSYGKCTVMLVPRDTTVEVPQGGTVDFPLDFLSGVMRGRFHPGDGQLYVSGLKGWVSSAVRDGCLQRVRYTGQRVTVPLSFETFSNGLMVRFSDRLDPQSATDPDSYHVTRWNYRYSAAYGSPEFRVSAPQEEGRDEVEVISATLLEDHRAVFLELPTIAPVMQMAVEYSLRGEGGEPLRRNLFTTLNRVRGERFPEERIQRRARPGQLSPEQLAKLAPGILVRSSTDTVTESHVRRSISYSTAPGENGLWQTSRGAVKHEFRGYLQVDLRGDYEFCWRAEGRVSGQPEVKRLTLQRGHNRFEMTVSGEAEEPDRKGRGEQARGEQAPSEQAPREQARGRVGGHTLWWRGQDFDWEPVPPTVLFHDRTDAALVSESEWRRGYWLYQDLHCGRCHDAAARGGAPGGAPGGAGGGAVRDVGGGGGAGTGRAGTGEVGTGGAGTGGAGTGGAGSSGAGSSGARGGGPALTGLGTRLQSDWVYEWLLAPQSQRHSATMPALLDAEQPAGRQMAADLAAFLSSLIEPQRPDRPAPGTAPGTVAGTGTGTSLLGVLVGAELFEDLGCIGCHRLTAPSEPDDFQRLSLTHISRKYRRDQLLQYLADPTRWYPTTRMPKFDLSVAERQALSDHLLKADEPQRGVADRPVGDVARGRIAFQSLNCGQCHALESGASGEPGKLEPVKLAAPIAIQDPTGGCLAEQPQRVRYRLTATDRAALRVYAGRHRSHAPVGDVGGGNAPVGDAPVGDAPVGDVAEHLVEKLRCTACHQRDHKAADLRLILAEESERGLVPEALPNLTFAGDRLRSSWLLAQFQGTAHEQPLGRARPWLKARMPAFPGYAEVLAAGLAVQHGRSPVALAPSAAQSVDRELAEIGRRLTLSQSGLDCRQCHAVGREQPTGDAGTRIAPGINFSLIHRRLNEDFFPRFVTNPPRYDVTTKMPRLVPDGRTSKVTDLLDGDAQRQFLAIWEYLRGL